MWFRVLGPLEVRSGTGAVVPVEGHRPRALLVMLALEAGRVVPVPRLIDGQYGDDPPAGAANALQAHVSRLRRRLPAGLIETHPAGYRLAADPGDVDAHRFERLAAEGRRLLSEGRPADAAVSLRAALALWHGPALPDLPTAQAQAARLDELRLSAAEHLAEAELILPGADPVPELRRLVAAHPLRERLHGQLMRALHARGRPAEALAVYEHVRHLLADELGADPSPELADIHLTILRGGAPSPRRPGAPSAQGDVAPSAQGDVAPSAQGDVAPSAQRDAASSTQGDAASSVQGDAVRRQGIAAQVSSFVGREEELARLRGLRHARLVTITGPGGTGKTRLAVEAAGGVPGDVCFADLAGVEPGDEVVWAVLGALGAREAGFAPGEAAAPVERLVAALRERDLTLVLDNCEHVIGPSAALVRRLLGECPRLRVLATSREPLGITGETLVPLGPLAVPPPGRPPEEAVAYPAIRLFADRAAAVRPGFDIAADVETVANVCAALDGLPLAIELAAARVRSFTVAEIAGRLAEHGRFRLLSRGDRTAAARHRTLRAVVAWSWDLLTAEERALARRFAVFTAGASLAAVEAVCDVEDAAGALEGLVDKSLAEASGGRYRMLDTIRLYCAERLAEAGEEEALRARHARHFLALARRADPHLRRAEQVEWLARLAADHGNLMAALRWAARHDTETGLRLVAALGAYWWLSGRRTQAGESAAELLRAVGEPPPGLVEEYVMCVVHAVPRAADEHWARAGTALMELGPPLRHSFTLALWGMAAGPPETVEAGVTERWLGDDPWNAALIRLSLALLAMFDGRAAEAEDGLLDVLAVFRSLGERWGTAQALDALAVLAARRGVWDRARETWEEALRLLEELGALEESADVLTHRGEAAVRAGDLALAADDFQRAAGLARRAGRPDPPALAHLGLGEVARLSGDLAAAREHLSSASRSTEPGLFGADGTRALAYVALARLAEAEGDLAASRRHLAAALRAVRRSPIVTDLAAVAEGHAGAALASGRPGRAALLLGAALSLRDGPLAGDPDVTRVTARTRDLLGPAAFTVLAARGAALGRDAVPALLGAP
ncbi:BTAD domain-containing putative transcriptional regulator [Sphaerisporangium sp. B11E5]|uniref:AfsR/SARP family transcriptional regulator n=1 Tax=Sphaerisporangium sp. B11E5 TaxID=3153563 RepID=UPI00325D3A9A